MSVQVLQAYYAIRVAGIQSSLKPRKNERQICNTESTDILTNP